MTHIYDLQVNKIAYTPRRFTAESMAMIDLANTIILDLIRSGFSVSLRQLYYQFVTRNAIENTERSYKRFGELINAARLAGHISWKAIEDRTRNLNKYDSWNSPEQIIQACADQISNDWHKNQKYRIEIWVEKDALKDVIAVAANKYRVPYLACRGYMSQSEMWEASQRYIEYNSNGQDVVIIHLGDHDPSGIDMTRDITDRLNLFIEQQGYCGNWNDHVVTVERVALNFDQLATYNPPPNPAKISDSRAVDYIRKFGNESWELDALAPQVLAEIISTMIEEYIDLDEIKKQQLIEQSWRDGLKGLVEGWRSTYAPMLGIQPDDED